MEAERSEIRRKVTRFSYCVTPDLHVAASQFLKKDALVFVYELNEYAFASKHDIRDLIQSYQDFRFVLLPSARGLSAIICGIRMYEIFCERAGVPSDAKGISLHTFDQCKQLFAADIPSKVIDLLDFHNEYRQLHPVLRIRELRSWLRARFPHQRFLNSQQLDICLDELGFRPTKSEVIKASR